ncbi:oligosaccharide flippase family protein [Halomonas litopenaei]|uniref:oligosaccharide flippase family protein n=1 Tax=Halomonas litopenaei TaxID=2109328 RepID=UPI001A8FA75A|nr:oligosaccharide flippase family protein [Halomonas litopenaei]MBN8410991.1 oligosaccharide flippase family protein [Halomonas litopenaei]
MASLKKLVFLGSDKVIALGLQFLGFIWIARTLEVSEFGKLNSAMSVFGMLSFVGALGASVWFQNQLIIKSKERELNEILRDVIVLRGLATLLQAMAAAVVLYVSSSDVLLLVVAFTVYHLFLRFDVLDFYLLEREKAHVAVLANVIGKATFAISCYACFKIDASLSILIFALPLDLLVSSFIKMVYLFNREEIFKNQKAIELKNLIKIFDNLKYLAIAGASTPLLLQSDVFVVKAIIGEEVAGLYAAASKIISPFLAAAMVVSIAFFSSIVTGSRKFLSGFFLTVFCTAVIISITVMMWSEEIIVLAYGEPFRPSSEILAVLVMALPAFSLGPILSRFMISKGLNRHEAAKNWFVAIVYLGLQLPGVAIWGAQAAAWSLVVCSYLLVIISFYVIYNNRVKG